MSNRAEYLALARLKTNPDYQVLVEKWLYILSKIEDARDKSAARGAEGNWRYYAGQEKGCKLVMMALDLALKDLETKDEELVAEAGYDDLLNEIRGTKI